LNLGRPLIAALLLSTLLLADNNETNVTSETNVSIFSKFSDKLKQAKENVIDTMDKWMAHEFNGNWHLREIDGKDTRYARAILELNLDTMKLSGFDACNQITGDIKETVDKNLTVPTVNTTWMSCREQIHLWTSRSLQETLKEKFTIKEGKKNGVKGIIIKSKSHELFLKQMGIEEEEEGWSSSFKNLFNKKEEETPKQN